MFWPKEFYFQTRFVKFQKSSLMLQTIMYYSIFDPVVRVGRVWTIEDRFEDRLLRDTTQVHWSCTPFYFKRSDQYGNIKKYQPSHKSFGSIPSYWKPGSLSQCKPFYWRALQHKVIETISSFIVAAFCKIETCIFDVFDIPTGFFPMQQYLSYSSPLEYERRIRRKFLSIIFTIARLIKQATDLGTFGYLRNSL